MQDREDSRTMPGSLARAARIAIATAVLAATFGGLGAFPLALRGLPDSEAKQGDAFVEAWLAFRRDLDGIGESHVHPALVPAWFADAPPFLVQDAARLSTHPQMVLAAVSRLASLGGAADLACIGEVEARYAGSDLSDPLRSLRILAGDAVARREALAALASSWPQKRLEAAGHLAASGDERGRSALRRTVLEGGPDSAEAARALGRFGAAEDEALLVRSSAKRPDDSALSAAVGEILTRRRFPDHYRAIVGLEPSPRLILERDGLYETWFDALGRAIRGGARSPREVLAHLEELKKHPPPSADAEAVQRRIAALLGLWTSVNEAIAATRSAPEWPRDFDEAMRAITAPDRSGGLPAADFARRISAEIWMLRAAGEKLGYARLAEPNAGLRALTPGGARALDGNLATAFHAAEGSPLALEWDAPVKARSLWVMSFCPYGGRSRVGRVEVTGSGAGSEWSVSAALDPETRYYQEVLLPDAPARRLALRLLEISGKEPACIAELRLR